MLTAKTIVTLVYLVILTVSGWVVTFQVRRRMKRAMGRKATDLELASISTWMKVQEVEQQREENKPIRPR